MVWGFEISFRNLVIHLQTLSKHFQQLWVKYSNIWVYENPFSSEPPQWVTHEDLFPQHTGGFEWACKCEFLPMELTNEAFLWYSSLSIGQNSLICLFINKNGNSRKLSHGPAWEGVISYYLWTSTEYYLWIKTEGW